MDRFRIDVFSSEHKIENEGIVLTSLLESGINALHLRKPRMTCRQIESILNRIPDYLHKRIILHDYPGLALKYGCGFQFNSRNLPQEGSFASRSFSCHSLNEIDDLSGQFDFLTLSPIFPSISKPGYEPSFNFSQLDSKRLTKTVALGGVRIGSVERLMKLGFAGAAFMGEIWNVPNGVERFLKFMRMRNFSFQFITDGGTAEETISQAKTVLESGGRWIQVRMKYADKEVIAGVLKRLLPMCNKNGATLVVDDHVSLSRLCHGVHLGQNDMAVTEAVKLMGVGKIIGLTVNNIEQIRQSEECLPDYYGVGPYRFTDTKKNLAPVLGIEGYRRLNPCIQRPFVAIGGIMPGDIDSLFEAGASGIAVSSVITKSRSPEEKCKEIINIIDKWKKIY